MEFFNFLLGLGTVGIIVLAILLPWLLKDSALQKRGVLIVGIVTAGAVLGSLTYSNIFQLEPCPLCWYQRIFMFPLPFILITAYIKHISRIWSVTLVLSVVGLLLSLYHIYIQFWSASGESVFCNSAVSEPCNIPYVMIFGFITIPVMAASVFLFTGVASYILGKREI